MAEIFHGGRLDAAIAKFGGVREEWLDLSTGINPNPYPILNIPVDAWARLPDANAENDLLDVAREYYGVPEGFDIVAAPGTQAIIERLPNLLAAPQVSIVSPTYAEHAQAWLKAGANVSTVEKPGNGNKVSVVVNPNNPTAVVHEHSTLIAAAAGAEWLIVDEAFADPIPDSSIVPQMTENMIVLKSFGKFFGLAGLRLGFVVCRSEVGQRVKDTLGPWAVSGPALMIGAAAMTNKNWVNETIIRLQCDSGKLSNMLKNNKFIVEGVNPLFVSVSHPRANDFQELLAQHRILVRPFPDRDGFLRIGLPANEFGFTRLQRVLEMFVDA